MKPVSFLSGRRRATCLLAAAALALAGCVSSVPDHFYTLSGVGASAPGAVRTAPGYFIEIPPVNVPQQVSRSQMVIERAPGTVELMEHERWSAPLADEIRVAVSADLTRLLGAIDVYRSPHPGRSPVYRVSISVEQFVSAPGKYAALDAVWSVRALPDGAVLTCRSALRDAIGGGYGEVVAGHRRLLHRLSGEIAAAIGQSVAAANAGASPAATCPASN